MNQLNLLSLAPCGTSAEPCGTSLQVIDRASKQPTYQQSYPHFTDFAKRLKYKDMRVERLAIMEKSVRNLAEPLAKSLIFQCGTSSAEPAEPTAKCLISLCGTSAEAPPPPIGGDRDPHRVGGSLFQSVKLRRPNRWRMA